MLLSPCFPYPLFLKYREFWAFCFLDVQLGSIWIKHGSSFVYGLVNMVLIRYSERRFSRNAIFVRLIRLFVDFRSVFFHKFFRQHRRRLILTYFFYLFVFFLDFAIELELKYELLPFSKDRFCATILAYTVCIYTKFTKICIHIKKIIADRWKCV